MFGKVRNLIEIAGFYFIGVYVTFSSALVVRNLIEIAGFYFIEVYIKIFSSALVLLNTLRLLFKTKSFKEHHFFL